LSGEFDSQFDQIFLDTKRENFGGPLKKDLQNDFLYRLFSQKHTMTMQVKFDNSTAMYENLHINLTPWRDSNPGSSVLEVGRDDQGRQGPKLNY
jgi:hypothetical protein